MQGDKTSLGEALGAQDDWFSAVYGVAGRGPGHRDPMYHLVPRVLRAPCKRDFYFLSTGQITVVVKGLEGYSPKKAGQGETKLY